MRKFLLATAAILISCSAASAQDDCIENVNGKIVCGADADAVRARMRAEEAIADGKDPQKVARRSSSGSIYSSFGQAAFVRGGYVFAADANQGLVVDGGGPSAYIGYRGPLLIRGNNALSLETEFGYQRAPRDNMLVSIDGHSSMLSLRWDHALSPDVGMFASGGVGVVYLRAYSTGVFLGDDYNFGYTGRTGLRTNIGRSLSLEAAYRYTGVTGVDFGLPVSVGLASHSGEIGLDLRF